MSSKFCPNCGAPLEGDAQFCTNCGYNLGDYHQPAGGSNVYQQPSYDQNAYQAPQYDQNAYQQQAYAPNPYQERSAYQEPVYQAPQYANQAQPQYNVNVYNNQAPSGPYGQYGTPPVNPLPTTRRLWKLILFSALTFGIYSIVVMSKISSEINVVASRYDGRKTMHYCLVFFIFSWLTFFIVPFVWQVKLSSRMGHELARRNIPYSFGAGTFWGWLFFGSLIFVGPFIYYHKFFKAMNLINANYNMYG